MAQEAPKPKHLPAREEVLDRAADRLTGLPPERKTALARAYTLYLELVNVCENAYCTHRLRKKLSRTRVGPGHPARRPPLTLKREWST